MNLNDIRRNYNNYADYQIKRIASEEAGSLKPEVLEILKSEIEKRNLDPNLIASVVTQSKELTALEITEYGNILKNHSCPKCESKMEKLNVTMVGHVTSILIWTSYEKSLKVACYGCLDEIHEKAIDKSILLGWWAIPWGPIQTVRSFFFNTKMKKNNRAEEPNELFNNFVLNNIGIIEIAKTDPDQLTEFLIRINE